MNKEQESMEKPNYKLTYKSICRNDSDWFHHNRYFQAAHDDQARDIATSFIKDHNSRAKGNWNLAILTPLRLETVKYVLKEIEETTQIPIEGDALSCFKNGIPMKLFELGQ